MAVARGVRGSCDPHAADHPEVLRSAWFHRRRVSARSHEVEKDSTYLLVLSWALGRLRLSLVCLIKQTINNN